METALYVGVILGINPQPYIPLSRPGLVLPATWKQQQRPRDRRLLHLGT